MVIVTVGFAGGELDEGEVEGVVPPLPPPPHATSEPSNNTTARVLDAPMVPPMDPDPRAL
jgi:hypothetical protein